MPSPLAHVLAAMTLYETRRDRGVDRGLLVLLVVCAVGPDLDFLPGMLTGRADRFHQGPSHSLVAGLLVGLVVGCFAGRTGHGWRTGGWATLAYVSHVLLDAVAVDTSLPVGVPLAWPFLDTHVSLSPKIFGDVTRDVSSEWMLRGLFNMHNLRTILREAAVMGVVWMIARALRRRRQGQV